MRKAMDSPNGRYWDKPWSLVDGCTPCSPGCEHCWSMAMGKRFHKWPGKVVTILSCEPVRVSEVTIADAERLGVVTEWDSLSANQQENLKEKYMRDAIGEDDLFYLLWHKRHPDKEWAWRVVSEEEN